MDPRGFYFIFIGISLIASVSTFGIDQLLYVYYESPTLYSKHNFDQINDIIGNPNFNTSLPNVLWVPGYLESPFSAKSQLVIEAYFKFGGANIFALQWLNGGTYTDAIANAYEAGTKLADNHLYLYGIGLSPSLMKLTGHGLGAHLLGHTGRTIIAKSNGMYILPRITGLDPARSLFYPSLTTLSHINQYDAAYVDIIHTDDGKYGTTLMTGTADFYVNMGKRTQPGCPVGVFPLGSDKDLCSHRRAIDLWAESLSTPSSTFTATLYGDPTVTSRLGIFSPTTTTPGRYTISTNKASPFSRG